MLFFDSLDEPLAGGIREYVTQCAKTYFELRKSFSKTWYKFDSPEAVERAILERIDRCAKPMQEIIQSLDFYNGKRSVSYSNGLTGIVVNTTFVEYDATSEYKTYGTIEILFTISDYRAGQTETF